MAAGRPHLRAVAPGDLNPLDIQLRDVVGTSARPLEKGRGIRTVGQLLDWLPRTYLDPARPDAFTALPHGEDVVVVGRCAPRAPTRCAAAGDACSSWTSRTTPAAPSS
ncbi:hypothetical protein [Ornithinimicrobium flavum]|uniref:hypothetical protein n=1 Tax=Ornithinimicrobium flavum TaxID=1288636 RepID=UPI001EE8F256|nr:hypothetical protein [Ornithinimicrobium flavum]